MSGADARTSTSCRDPARWGRSDRRRDQVSRAASAARWPSDRWVLGDQREAFDAAGDREPGADLVLEGGGGGCVDAVGDREVRDRVGDRAAVRRTVREGGNRGRDEVPERCGRVGGEVHDLTGEARQRREGDVARWDVGGDPGEHLGGRVVDDRAERVEDGHVGRDTGCGCRVVLQPEVGDERFRLRHQDHERRLVHRRSLAREDPRPRRIHAATAWFRSVAETARAQPAGGCRDAQPPCARG